MAKKPTIFIDTNIISALHFRGGEVSNVARRLRTEEWWELERRHFELWASNLVEDELQRGRYRAQELALRAARRISYLAPTQHANEIANELIASKVIPGSKPGDALHLGMAIAARMDGKAKVRRKRKAGQCVARRPRSTSPESKR